MPLTPKKPSKFNHYGRIDLLEKALQKLPTEFGRIKAEMIRSGLENTAQKQQIKQLMWKIGRLECEIDALTMNAKRWEDYRVSQKFSTYMNEQMGQMFDGRA